MINDTHYSTWNERTTIHDCLESLGFNDLAVMAHDSLLSQEIIDEFLLIIKHEAKKRKAHDVLEQLYFSGLIYG